jgi:MATE family multidrug resistance protein
MNLMLNILLRFQLPRLLSSDDAVVAITAQVLPLVAFVQVFDGLSAGAHGILRGIGKQSIGGPANLFAYYVISLPLSMTLLFRFGWKLEGLWLGLVVGLIT